MSFLQQLMYVVKSLQCSIKIWFPKKAGTKSKIWVQVVLLGGWCQRIPGIMKFPFPEEMSQRWKGSEWKVSVTPDTVVGSWSCNARGNRETEHCLRDVAPEG